MNHDLALEAAVDRVAELLHVQIGLRPEPTLRGRLRRAVREEAATHGQDLDGYLTALASRREALQQLLNRITVQETSFFRHPEHFDVLARDVLPSLAAPVRIWSAGCAHGQEAYSIAMILEEHGIAGSVVATDLSTSALHRTATARYAARELSGLSAARVARHFTEYGKSWQINPALRDRVSVSRHNLVDPLPEQVRHCQVVFCRNVLIYFTPQHARALLDRVADALPRNGVLFLGAAEAIWPVSDRFDTVRTGDTFVYRPRQTTAHPAAAPVPPPRPDSRVRRRGADASARLARRVPPAATRVETGDPTRELVEAGRRALNANEYQQAVVAFRKWAYLAPDDPIAHLHLGLALESSGDLAAARRAFGAAHRAVLESDRATLEQVIDGYGPDELLRLLESKHQDVTR